MMKKRLKGKRQTINKCSQCRCTEEECDLEEMPCCGRYLCWEECLYNEPNICPLCGARIKVESKDPITKESYVELIAQKKDSGYIFVVEIESKLPLSKLNIDDALRPLIGNGKIKVRNMDKPRKKKKN